MGFQRLDLLPSWDQAECHHLISRWESYRGRELAGAVIDGIKGGAGKYFMGHIVDDDDEIFFRHSTDLAGLSLSGLDLTFSDEFDNFKYIDFSYAPWYTTRLNLASFFQCHFRFNRFYNVKFTDCIFCLTSFYGCIFERCEFLRCDFVDENGFTNCRFSDISLFDSCFFNKNKLIDCCMDSSCEMINRGMPSYLYLRNQSYRMKEILEVKNISGIFQGMQNCYANGSDSRKSRHFSFKSSQAKTRFNSSMRIQNYLWEYLAGYGLKPFRVFAAYLSVFLISLMWFLTKLDVSDAIILSAGAILTFGAKAELLSKLGLADTIIYLFSAFAGVSLLSLLVTVIATKILAES